MTRDPAVDGLRGTAILGVVGYHAGWLDGGWAGVNLFFALSGYLITSLLLREHERTATLDLRRFWRQRVARLLPAGAIALLGLATMTWLLHPEDVGRVSVGIVVVLAYAANLALTWYPVPQVQWAWSLSLEEQFYVLWPVVLLRALRRRVPLLALARGAVLVAAAVVAVRLLVGRWHPQLAYATVRGDELLLGCALALAPVRVRRGWGFLAVGVLGAVWAVGSPGAGAVTVAGLASVVLVAAVLSGFARPVLSSALLRFLGRISYALYLWSCGLGAVLLGYPGDRVLVVWLVSSFALAYASTRYVEEPLRARAAQRRAERSSPGFVGGGA